MINTVVFKLGDRVDVEMDGKTIYIYPELDEAINTFFKNKRYKILHIQEVDNQFLHVTYEIDCVLNE